MDLPKVALIGSIPYVIEQEKDCGPLGYIHFKQGRIVLDDGLNPFAAATVLAHEIIHGLLFELALDEETEEQVAATIGKNLPLFIRENFDIIEFLASPHTWEPDEHDEEEEEAVG